MNLFDALPIEDVALINNYINRYGGDGESASSYMDSERMPYFLRFWDKAKAPFYQAFGNQFIIKREICFEKPMDELEDEMDRYVRYGEAPVQKFKQHFRNHIATLGLTGEDAYALRCFVDDTTTLVNNIYDGDAFVIKGDYTIDGHPLQINSGCKAIKMLGKICKATGFTSTTYRCARCGQYHDFNRENCWCGEDASAFEAIDGYEAFRRAHSLVLNQKLIKGNLCLSIHPMDFITASDNESGWSSCMEWMDSAGDYRLGTIEMMNSDNVIIAYVEAKDPMYIDAATSWNNKRWRQFIVVTPELILGNKQYPYESDIVQGTALQWVRELAQKMPGFGPYDDTAVNICNKSTNVIGNRSIYINLYFDYMYNDIYDHRLGFIKVNFSGSAIEYNLSGPAVCTNCGSVIYREDSQEPSWTICSDCAGVWRCTYCGDLCSGEAYYTEDRDDPFCWYCYENRTSQCECCGDRVIDAHNVFIRLLKDPPDSDLESCNWGHCVTVCSYCYNHADNTFLNKFGQPFWAKDMWGRDRRVISIDTISDEGMQEGDIDANTRSMLIDVRNEKNREKRIELIQKYFL